MMVIGDVKGKDVLIIDDIIDTAGTICKAAELMIEQGALSVSAMCTHPVLSGPAFERIENSVIKELIVTDTIRLKQNSDNYNKTIQISVNESFRRTFFTSITTLMPLLTLIIFGSYSLFWFSVSLSLGILIGSYSSILLAPSFLIKD